MKKNISPKQTASKAQEKQKPKAKLPVSFYDAKLLRTLGLIVAFAGVVFYFQTISYSFTLDDYSAIKENRVTKMGASAIGTIFKTSYRYGYTIQGDELYRPIPKSIFAIIWSISPDSPFLGHLLNILLYGLTGFLLFMTFTKYLTKNIYVPFIASLLFMAHPIHTEVTASIKSLDEILGLLFFILSLNLLHTYLQTDKLKWIIVAAISYMASLMSKESSITFVAIFPLTIYFFTKAETSKNIKASVWMLAVAIVFLIIRAGILKGNNAGPPSAADNMIMLAVNDIGTQKTTAIYLMGYYLKLLFFPHPLVFDYSVNQIELVKVGNWKFIVSLLVYLALGAYAVMNFKKKDLIAYGILFFFITASLSSNVLMVIGTHLGERLMYAPSLGFCFAIAALLSAFINKMDADNSKITSVGNFFLNRPALMGIVLVITVAFAGKTFAQNPVWKDNLSLYEHGVKGSPNSTRTHYYLGNYITKEDYYKTLSKEQKDKEIRRGIDELKKSISIYQFSESYLSLGVVYYRLNMFDSSMYYYNEAIRVAPNIATIHNNVGTVYFETKQYDKALIAFQRAVQLDQNYSEAYCNLGSAYGTLGQLDNAIFNFQKAIEIDPNNAMANYFMGITLQNSPKQQDKLRAQLYFDKAAALDPQYKK